MEASANDNAAAPGPGGAPVKRRYAIEPSDRPELLDELTKVTSWSFLEDSALIRALRTEPVPDARRLARELKRTHGQVMGRLNFLRATRFRARKPG